jgi:hypothetical protein
MTRDRAIARLDPPRSPPVISQPAGVLRGDHADCEVAAVGRPTSASRGLMGPP